VPFPNLFWLSEDIFRTHCKHRAEEMEGSEPKLKLKESTDLQKQGCQILCFTQ
jgi:hypothetical protein